MQAISNNKDKEIEEIRQQWKLSDELSARERKITEEVNAFKEAKENNTNLKKQSAEKIANAQTKLQELKNIIKKKSNINDFSPEEQNKIKEKIKERVSELTDDYRSRIKPLIDNFEKDNSKLKEKIVKTKNENLQDLKDLEKKIDEIKEVTKLDKNWPQIPATPKARKAAREQRYSQDPEYQRLKGAHTNAQNAADNLELQDLANTVNAESAADKKARIDQEVEREMKEIIALYNQEQKDLAERILRENKKSQQNAGTQTEDDSKSTSSIGTQTDGDGSNPALQPQPVPQPDNINPSQPPVSPAAVNPKVSDNRHVAMQNNNISSVHNNIHLNRLQNTVVAAGEEMLSIKRGVWINPLISKMSQKSMGKMLGYKGATHGGSIGLDFEINDTVLGVAYSHIKSKLKYSESFNKAFVDTNAITLYGQKLLPHNFVLQGMATYAHNNVKSLHTDSVKHKTINKGHNNHYLLETILKYNHKTSGKILITPSLGFKYDYHKIGIYSQDPSDNTKLLKAHSARNDFAVKLGATIAMPIITSKCIDITPSIHGGIEHKLNNKKLRAKLGDEVIKLPKKSKYEYNLGMSLEFSKNNVTSSIGYNLNLDKKYKNQEGFVKVKVAF